MYLPTYVFNDSGDSLVIGVVAFKFFIFIFQGEETTGKLSARLQIFNNYLSS